ncbi:hypothetical protein BJY04DRAFT_216164 [Aspergillus karnatakaensis]|uniref:uncharacterized protein n=1 Tax=Aspergillus karnatakaensis TaxID=1810916 RepID=UPI003CCCDCA5
MKVSHLLALAVSALAVDHGSSYGGSGPYKSYYFEVESLPNHTFYQPLQSGLEHSSKLKLPVIVWVGLKFRNFLGEVTSWGALAIATGPVFTDPSEYSEPPSDPANPASGQNPAALTESIDWVYKHAGKGAWKHIDKTRIGVWGQSCGGLEAYSAGAHDDRVSHLAIFNSGQLSVNASESVAGKITKPVFYSLGGPGDVAYPNGNRDYEALPDTTPAWKGSHELGHSEAFDVPFAGIPGVTGRKILQWILRGDKSARKWFVDEQAHQAGYVNVTYQSLESVRVTPIH